MQARADRELIEASCRGDRAAFAEIIERYQRPVYAVAFSGVRDRALADDIAQDAFLIAWRRLDELRDTRRLPAWLCGIARNLARDARKRLRRETLDDTDRVVTTTTPYDAMTEAESERTLAAALGQVPDVYREPLVLYYYEERSVEDVARSLGITAATTNKRLSRGRQYLAERVAIVERGVPRRGVKPAFAASVLALIGITVPASHVDASPAGKGSTMHKLAIAATVTAIAAAGTIGVVAATRGGDAHASASTTTASATELTRDHASPGHASSGAPRAGATHSIADLFGKRRARTAAAAVPAATDCATVGKHLADLESNTGGAHDPVRCATDYTSICETEGWSLAQRACVIAADDLMNAHLCAHAQSSTPPTDIPPALACSAIGSHVAPIVQAAGMYADVPDLGAQIESACDTGAWSLALRQCLVAGQAIDELHGCMQGDR
jgi:RNA polymerase sigma factor (sigma-70 family)